MVPGDATPSTLESDLTRATVAARFVLRRKLNVTLRPEDGRPENQDALELLTDIQLRLLRKLQSPSHDIQNLDFYARQSALNACAEYLRARFPHRALLKNRVRRFFRTQLGYAEWDLDGEFVCGFAGWRNRPEYKPDTAKISAALADPAGLASDSWPRKSFDQLHLSDWEALIEPLLDALGCAIELDDLISILAPRLGVKDFRPSSVAPSNDDADSPDPSTSLDFLSRPADPDAEIYLREILSALWRSLLQMDIRKRCAFLLNPPSMEIELLPVFGIATIPQISAALDLSDAQFATLTEALPLDDSAREFANAQHDRAAKFASLWNHLPLRDAHIGKILGLTPQQVINQRMLARRVLSRELAGLLSRRKK